LESLLVSLLLLLTAVVTTGLASLPWLLRLARLGHGLTSFLVFRRLNGIAGYQCPDHQNQAGPG